MSAILIKDNSWAQTLPDIRPTTGINANGFWFFCFVNILPLIFLMQNYGGLTDWMFGFIIRNQFAG
jgi:hypothetical protein